MFKLKINQYTNTHKHRYYSCSRAWAPSFLKSKRGDQSPNEFRARSLLGHFLAPQRRIAREASTFFGYLLEKPHLLGRGQVYSRLRYAAAK